MSEINEDDNPAGNTDIVSTFQYMRQCDKNNTTTERHKGLQNKLNTAVEDSYSFSRMDYMFGKTHIVT